MWSMNDSMAQADSDRMPLDVPRWRSLLGWTGAVVLALLFYISGLWKITDPQGAAVRMAQARVPESLSLAAAVTFGIVETVAATLLIVPRLRRWGAALTGVLLLAFLFWFALHYNALRGADCSCFPWLKRVVGPGFFIGDGLMLALALAAGFFSPRPHGLRGVALITGAVVVFALVSWGVATVAADRHPGAGHSPGGRPPLAAKRGEGAPLLFRSAVHALFRRRAETVHDPLGRHPRPGGPHHAADLRPAVHG